VSRTIAGALALAEYLLPARFRDGRQVVRVADAHVLLSGHAPRVVAGWEQWSEADKQRLGTLLGTRHRGEARRPGNRCLNHCSNTCRRLCRHGR
jgi:hypothetical protein